MYKVTCWHCDYCTKHLANRNRMAAHEKRCMMNPETRSCGTCENLEYEVEGFRRADAGGERSKTELNGAACASLAGGRDGAAAARRDKRAEVSVPGCRIGKMKWDPKNKRNPWGMRTQCEGYVKKHENEM